ncbi:hypothetical protein SAMN05216207_1013140 [Pseudonocardia ammonioxydans]|uniref:Uncharacterized protein n=1 Tax=Pseudonocardia ammonioxydans TaxID=260086 RepID=A0A1I4YL56_PSUAM|nr:hypothetical protein [Pseudonocardia ammonioxydans]SFN38781.1 hypothetical protein SAMN05216207_1013140 [Pseudonocardia ammonioxydans]
MADDAVDHLAMAEEAARLHCLAVAHDAEGRRDEALTAAEEAAGLYRALARDFPVLFGADAERADALAAAIRDGRPVDPAMEPVPVRARGPVAGPSAPAVVARDTARAPDAPAVATPVADPPAAPVDTRPRRWRRGVLPAAAVAAVLFGTLGAVGRPLAGPPPAPVQVRMQPPPAPVAVDPWTATPRADVAPPGVALRSAPSTTGDPAGRLAPGEEVRIQCGEVGRMTASETGERSAAWLRTTAGSYLAAVNVEFRGPSPIRNCTAGQPAVPLPHHR